MSSLKGNRSFILARRVLLDYTTPGNYAVRPARTFTDSQLYLALVAASVGRDCGR